MYVMPPMGEIVLFCHNVTCYGPAMKGLRMSKGSAAGICEWKACDMERRQNNTHWKK